MHNIFEEVGAHGVHITEVLSLKNGIPIAELGGKSEPHVTPLGCKVGDVVPICTNTELECIGC